MGKVIVLDYGHGGHDAGATHQGRYEKDDVLKLGKDLTRRLRGLGYTVVETREDDSFISLNDRCMISNNKNVDLFLSLHRNAFDGVASGVECWVYNEVGFKYDLASDIVDSLSTLGFVNRGVKTGNFRVLKGTKTQAMLLELGFIDNILDNHVFDSKYNLIIDIITANINLYLGGDELGVGGVVYRVIAGSYQDEDNAIRQINYLESLGIDCFMERKEF